MITSGTISNPTTCPPIKSCLGAPTGYHLPLQVLLQVIRKGFQQTIYWRINVPTKKVFKVNLEKALGQVASGKWFLQESLPTPNFLKCFQKEFFFSENIFF